MQLIIDKENNVIVKDGKEGEVLVIHKLDDIMTSASYNTSVGRFRVNGKAHAAIDCNYINIAVSFSNKILEESQGKLVDYTNLKQRTKLSAKGRSPYGPQRRR